MPGPTRPNQRILTGGRRPSHRLRHGPGVLILSMAAALAVFLHWRDMPPNVSIPTHTLPSPNAYVDFLRAASLQRDQKKVGEAISTFPGRKPYSASEKAALVQENAGALEALRQGLSHPYMAPAMRTASAGMSYYGSFRALARLLELESQVRASRGDWAGAVSSDLDCIRMGIRIPNGGTVITMLVGAAVQSMGQRQLWLDLPHLNAQQSLAAAHRLWGFNSSAATIGTILQEEKWFRQSSLLETMKAPNWRWKHVSSEESEDRMQAIRDWLDLARFSKKELIDHNSRFMDQLIADGSLPYATYRPMPQSEDPLSLYLLRVVDVYFDDTKTEAKNALLVTSLALHAYKLDHHHSPGSLQELVPDYFSTIPRDPFALSAAVCYRHTDAGDLVYSVGPDGRDDGGIPAGSGTASSNSAIQPDSRGDILAGTKR